MKIASHAYHSSESPRLRQNNFDLMRILFAVTVCLVHAYELSDRVELAWIGTIFSSKVAVESFFVISGILIFMSYEKTPSLGVYLSKRLRRIYPAYCLVILLSAFALWAVSSLNWQNYFSLDWFKYLLSNLTFLNFLHPTLPGVFTANKISAVNGSLWTLKVEVMFYMAVPFIVYLFKRFGYFSTMVVLYALSTIYAQVMLFESEKTGSSFWFLLAHQLPGQLTYFMAGAFIFYYLPLFEKKIFYFMLFSMSVLVTNYYYPLPILEPIAIAFVVAFLGFYGSLGNFAKYGDFSYGLYIIHFPVIQLVLYLGYFKYSAVSYLLAVLGISIVGSIVLWHIVEKRFLLRQNHFSASKYRVSNISQQATDFF